MMGDEVVGDKMMIGDKVAGDKVAGDKMMPGDNYDGQSSGRQDDDGR